MPIQPNAHRVAVPAVGRKPSLDPVEQPDLDDRQMLRRHELAGLQLQPARVVHVREQIVQDRPGEEFATLAHALARPGFVPLGPVALGIQVLSEPAQRRVLQVPLEDQADQGGLGLVDHQGLVREIVAEDHGAPSPQPVLTHGGQLVLRPLGDGLTLPLGHTHDDVLHELPGGCLAVGGVHDAVELGTVLGEEFAQHQPVQHVPAEPVAGFGHDGLDLPGLHGRHEVMQAGPVHRAARFLVAEDLGVDLPALLDTDLDVVTAVRFLGSQGRELAVDLVLGGRSDVDGRADGRGRYGLLRSRYPGTHVRSHEGGISW
ncbi:MAG: hypothetical protein AAB152_18515 [Candidatus Coatesbacteria bacterium]